VNIKFAFLLIGVAGLIASCNSPTAELPAPTLSPVEARGKEVFNLHCATCHATSPDVVIVGPSLAGVALRAGERVEGIDAKTYLQTSILKPSAYLVPGFPDSMLPELAKQLTSEEFDAVVDYLLTLE
jgi:mono/diheme cytochrome c family protein